MASDVFYTMEVNSSIRERSSYVNIIVEDPKNSLDSWIDERNPNIINAAEFHEQNQGITMAWLIQQNFPIMNIRIFDSFPYKLARVFKIKIQKHCSQRITPIRLTIVNLLASTFT